MRLLLYMLQIRKNKITNYTIIGERCSGTTYLENLMYLNFDIEITWKYGRKHFFGFNEYKDSDNTLFICIVRDPHTWINSFFRNRHHLPFKNMTGLSQAQQIIKFLTTEFYSINDDKNNNDNTEIMEDRNIYTGNRYKNIFELRYTKLKFMMEDLPKKVKNVILIRYEDLLGNFHSTMKKIRSKGLTVRNDLNSFPVNTDQYKFTKKHKFSEIEKTKKNVIPKYVILNHYNFLKQYREYEKQLKYVN